MILPGALRLSFSKLTRSLVGVGVGGGALALVYGLGTFHSQTQCKNRIALKQADVKIDRLHKTLQRREKAKVDVITATERLQSRRDLVKMAQKEALGIEIEERFHEKQPVSDDIILTPLDVTELHQHYERAFPPRATR